jgi:hypothetical protein
VGIFFEIFPIRSDLHAVKNERLKFYVIFLSKRYCYSSFVFFFFGHAAVSGMAV